MRIAVDVSRLSGQRLGVGRYLEYMLKYWSTMLAGEEQVLGYLRESVPRESVEHLGLGPRVELRTIGPKLTGTGWQNLTLAHHARAADVLFCPSYTAPLAYPSRTPLVVATHSVNEVGGAAHPWWYDLTYKQLYRLAARKADAVVVPCDTTKRLVMEAYRVPERRIHVIEQGADPSFRPERDPQLISATRTRMVGEDVPYVLFVGKLSQRRNIPNLIAGFADAKRAAKIPHKLLLVGPNHLGLPLDEICAKHGVRDSVIQTDGKFTHHTDLVPIYNAADFFVHPSTFEGWSMTTVEALACGTATIASDREGLRDVASGHARMVNDVSAAGLAQAIAELACNEELKEQLRRKARRRGEMLTWEDTTRRTLDVVRSVA